MQTPQDPQEGDAPATLLTPLVGTIMVALLAAMSPLSVVWLESEDHETARADSRRLGQAILAFHLDTGGWPVNDDGDPSTAELSRLVRLPAERIASEDRHEGLDPIHPESAAAPDHPGWNGPYLDSVPLDPWGRPYVCNVRHLDGAGVPGVARDAIDRHAVHCLSAGPNGRFDTPLADERALGAPLADDVGWPIQAEQRL